MIDVRARNNSSARNGLRFLLRAASAVLTLLFITSCGNDIFLVGTPIITFTAQRGHFTSYIVTIDEIEMTRKDGTVIELPTVDERVDLANLPNWTGLLEVPAVGIGTYVSVTFFLDYGTPYVTIDNQGVAMQTTLTDSSTGTTPTVDTVTVNFDPNNPLVITSQQSSPVNFNIDLEASNTIDTTNGATAQVTVHPMFTVTAAPIYQKPVFSRGLFVFADTTAGNFVMNTRPLHDVLNNPFGALTVIPNAQTYWNINGTPMVGAAGLTALATLQSETASLQIGVVATPGFPFGNLDNIQPSMTAAQIYVGTSLESTIQDHITGIVASYANGEMEVLGAALVDRLGLYGYQTYVPVYVGSQTVVTVDGADVPADLSSVAIGQFVDVAGQDTVTTDGLNNPTSLDATQGQIRLQPTTLWGSVTSATPGTANVNFLAPVTGWFSHYEPFALNFGGAPLANGVDSTLANYVINTGSTDLSSTASGTLVQFIGLGNPPGQEPPTPPYFTANTVTPASSLPQQLVIEYGANGSVNPFSAIIAPTTGDTDNDTIYVNLQDVTLSQAVINSGPASTNIIGLPTLPNPQLFAIVLASSGNQSEYLFTIGNVTNSTFVFSDPNAFAAKIPVMTALAGVTKIVATGQWDGAGSFYATDLKIAMY
jgi:hypothetical protein